MKNIMQKILLTLATTAGISLIALLLTSPVAANDYSRINNGLIPREPNFVQQGREQFEREIQVLIKKGQNNQEPVLKITPNIVRTQEDLLRLEKPQLLPSEPKKSEHN
jgi:cell fate regulator YaaT (PSP1 superfamily)